jgi:WD40 repeat protein
VAWNTADTELFTVQAVGDASLAAAWHGEALVVVAREPGSATVSHWRLNPAEAPRTDGESPCVGLAWQDEGRSLVSLHRDRRVVVRSAVEGGEQASWQLRPTAPRCAPALDPSGRWVAYGTALDHRLALFDVHAGRHARELPVTQIRLNGNRPWWLAFSADGTYLGVSYTTTENCLAAACWRVADGALLCAWTYSPLTWTVLAVSPDGSAIAKGARRSENEPIVAIIEVQTGRVLCLSPQGSEVSALAYAATGAHLASGDEAGLVACWRCGDWTQAWTGQLPAAVVHVAFTPDGSWLWAQGADGTVRAWRTRDGEEVASVLMPLGGGAVATGFAVSDKAVAVALEPCGVLLQPLGRAAKSREGER